jgi:uncharacterized protein YndB with AHSA1/START domain
MATRSPLKSTSGEDFTTSRIFDAPRDLVWKAFTEPQHLKHWWGPKGFSVIAATVDLRPGGRYHYGLKAPDGSEMWGKFEYLEITPPERLVFINSFSDKEGGTTRHPGHMSWPLEMRSVFTFKELPGGKTRFTLNWAPWNATPAEQKTFDDNHRSMQMGWGGSLDVLTEYLSQIQKEMSQ